MVAIQRKQQKYLQADSSRDVNAMLIILSVEAFLMVVGYNTVFYNIALLMPFRIVLWSLLLRHQLSEFKQSNLYYCALLSIPYLITIVFASEWFFSIELSKLLSYHSGLLFTPIFVLFGSIYVSTLSLAASLEIMCLTSFVVVLFLQIFLHGTMDSFWYALILPYAKTAANLPGLNLNQSEFEQILHVISTTMTTNLVIQYLLSPMLMSSLIVLFFFGRKQELSHWLSLRMSWSAFCVTTPLFFIAYSLMILTKSQLLDLSVISLSVIYGFFEIVRFIPAVSGLSFIHYSLCKRYQSGSKFRVFWMCASTLIFYIFGALFYPFCAFLGLMDRVIDLRKSLVKEKS